MAIDTVYLCHFVDPFWGDILGERGGNRFKFEASALELGVEGNFMQSISAFFGVFLVTKKRIGLKSSLDLYFHCLFIKFFLFAKSRQKKKQWLLLICIKGRGIFGSCSALGGKLLLWEEGFAWGGLGVKGNYD